MQDTFCLLLIVSRFPISTISRRAAQAMSEFAASVEAPQTPATPHDAFVIENEESSSMHTTGSTAAEDMAVYSPFTVADLKDDPTEPLFTEINIPLPPLPKPVSILRQRAHSLQSFRPFQHRRGPSIDSNTSKASKASSTSSTSSATSASRPRKGSLIKSRETAAAMDLRKGHKRSRTIDALAVVPAVLVLRAELFTPTYMQNETRHDRKEVKWEDGMI